MTEKTEALRLADALWSNWFTMPSNEVLETAAAELHRLHIENEALGLHLSERMKDLASVEAQRDALLEACRAMLTFIERHAPRGLQPEPGSPVAMARTAIAKADGGQ